MASPTRGALFRFLFGSDLACLGVVACGGGLRLADPGDRARCEGDMALVRGDLALRGGAPSTWLSLLAPSPITRGE